MLPAAAAAGVDIRLCLRPRQGEGGHQYSEQQTGKRPAHEQEDSTTSHYGVTMCVLAVETILQQILAGCRGRVRWRRRWRK
jgi:hypothetical protein